MPLWLSSAAAPADKLEYNRDIRPILAENCFACHGPDSAARKADLRLDQRDDAVKAGAIVPGKPEKSELVERIFADDPERDDAAAEVAQEADRRRRRRLLKRWIADGAEYQPHWSFIAPKRPPLPAVKNDGVGAQPDRPLHPGRSWRSAACSRPRKPTAARWPAA